MAPPLFQPLRTTLYSVEELYRGFEASRPQSYAETTDFRIYLQYLQAGSFAPKDYLLAMMEAVHDNAIRQATQDFLDLASARAAVAFMGGHELARSSPVYAEVAFLARDLCRLGYLPISGGGPGAMEATHLGALHRGVPRAELVRSLRELARAPELPGNLPQIVAKDGRIDRRLARKAHAWLLPAFRIRRRIRKAGVSLAVPTWLYGHEPATPFATKIAKYFQNSVREDRLLAIATHGVIYFEGGAGTLQEVFQDAAQNVYRIQGDFSPMVFFGTRQWLEALPVIPVLRNLFSRKEFNRHVCVTDVPAAVVDFLAKHGRRETPSQRLLRCRPAEGIAQAADRQPSIAP